PLQGAGLRLRSRRLEFEPLATPELSDDLELPDEFVAVHFRFAPVFPDSETNRELVRAVILKLAEFGPVVALDLPEPLLGPLAGDTDVRFVSSPGYALQSAIIARSRGVV